MIYYKLPAIFNNRPSVLTILPPAQKKWSLELWILFNSKGNRLTLQMVQIWEDLFQLLQIKLGIYLKKK